MGKAFASEYSRTAQGWVKFPPDQYYRKDMFPEEVNKHVAKANVFLIQSIIEYVSKPGELLLDPMAGTGTLLVGALIARSVICIEISPMFHELQKLAVAKLETIAPGISEQVSLINMACQLALPMPGAVDHIIFSPPYAGILKKGKVVDKLTTEKMGSYDWVEYTFTSPLNIGLMNDWLWKMEMEKVYMKCFLTLKPKGTMTVIVKDHMKDRQRVKMTQAAVDACRRCGFELEDWFKWNAPGTAYTHIYRSKGWETVDDEDIIVMRRP